MGDFFEALTEGNDNVYKGGYQHVPMGYTPIKREGLYSEPSRKKEISLPVMSKGVVITYDNLILILAIVCVFLVYMVAYQAMELREIRRMTELRGLRE
jgi:hypothetical protein